MLQHRRFILICSGDDSVSTTPSHPPAGAAFDPAVYFESICTSLKLIGANVEIWSVRRDGDAAIGVGLGGCLIRRFPGLRDHLVPRLRPCWWVSEWVARATDQLAANTDPADAITLVTFDWEAGIAGRLLAERFGLDLIHVPDIAVAPPKRDSDALSTNHPTRCEREEHETCRRATLVLAATTQIHDSLLMADWGAAAPHVLLLPAGPDCATRLLAALPAPKRRARAEGSDFADQQQSVFPLAVQYDNDDTAAAAAQPLRHLRWRFELELAKYALLGSGRPTF